VSDSPEERESKFAWKADFYMSIDYRSSTTAFATARTPGRAIEYIRWRAVRRRASATARSSSRPTRNKWWESREQTFVDEIVIDYAQLFTWMAGVELNQSSIMYITVKNIPTVNESYTNMRGLPCGWLLVQSLTPSSRS
jgi:hypothetical protein